MSGASVPYQLRPNKYVERQLFAELLAGVDRVRPVANYFYVSMGGRLMEDFKLIHSRFGVTSMISIEMNEAAYNRQIFNKPLAQIRCYQIPSRDLIDQFDRYAKDYIHRNAIVWLDYAIANDRGEQLSEYRRMLGKLKPFDVAKITLNANPGTLVCRSKGKKQNEAQREGLEELERQLGEYTPDPPYDYTVMTAKKLPQFLAEAVRKAAIGGLESDRGLIVAPLSAFVYNDAAHDMLTMTCIILEDRIETAGRIEATDTGAMALTSDSAFEVFLKESRLASWSFLATAWNDVRRIAIPDLSLKERAAIHETLNAPDIDLKSAHASLRFQLGEDEEESLKELAAYADHYRYYPSFLSVNV
jgi:hypothetical protein